MQASTISFRIFHHSELTETTRAASNPKKWNKRGAEILFDNWEVPNYNYQPDYAPDQQIIIKNRFTQLRTGRKGKYLKKL